MGKVNEKKNKDKDKDNRLKPRKSYTQSDINDAIEEHKTLVHVF